MARQQEHIAPSEVQIKPGTLEETYKSILRGKLLNEEDLPTIVGQLKSMSVRRSEFECLQAEVGALRVDLETFKKECCGIRTRDFVRGVIQRTSGVDQRELVLQYGTYKRGDIYSSSLNEVLIGGIPRTIESLHQATNQFSTVFKETRSYIWSDHPKSEAYREAFRAFVDLLQ